MIKHEAGKLILTILIIFNIGIIVNGQVIGVEEASQMEQGLNIQGVSLYLF